MSRNNVFSLKVSLDNNVEIWYNKYIRRTKKQFRKWGFIMENINIKSFECGDVQQYTNSLLFESGEHIASMTATSGDSTLTLELAIVGDVCIEFGDSFYNYPHEYPEELVKAIKDGNTDAYEVNSNNWYEVFYTLKNSNSKTVIRSSSVWEDDMDDATPEALKSEMLDYAKVLFGTYDSLLSLIRHEEGE
jgi:hypothetical protein